MNTLEAINALAVAGRIFGKNYPNYKQSASLISEDIDKAAKEKLKELEAENSSGCFLHVINILLFLTGLVLLSLAFTDSKFWPSWFWVSGFWVVGILVLIARSGSKLDWSAEELFDSFFDSAAAEIEYRRSSEIDSSQEPEEEPRPRGPKPLPQPYGVSHEGAEALCAAWMRHLGEMDAEYTRVVGDGGIDVLSARFIGQVKNYSGSVGVASIRELAGVAVVDGRKAIFFTSGTYASGAISFANQCGIALFIYDAVAGSLTHANQLAKNAILFGL